MDVCGINDSIIGIKGEHIKLIKDVKDSSKYNNYEDYLDENKKRKAMRNYNTNKKRKIEKLRFQEMNDDN